jgi:hypothetical protein
LGDILKMIPLNSIKALNFFLTRSLLVVLSFLVFGCGGGGGGGTPASPAAPTGTSTHQLIASGRGYLNLSESLSMSLGDATPLEAIDTSDLMEKRAHIWSDGTQVHFQAYVEGDYDISILPGPSASSQELIQARVAVAISDPEWMRLDFENLDTRTATISRKTSYGEFKVMEAKSSSGALVVQGILGPLPSYAVDFSAKE